MRLGGVHGGIGTDPGKNLIPRYQQIQFARVEARVLGGMSCADDDFPFLVPDPQHLAIREPHKAVRQWMDHLTEVTEPGAVLIHLGVAPSGPPIEANAIDWRFPPRIGKHHPTAQILVSCHPKRAFEATCQPSRHAHMIRVHVRRYHTGDGTAG